MKKYPVSVVVPTIPSRKDFLEGYVLPSIEGNHPEEIIIIEDEGTASQNRNKGAAQASSKYLFFCDDDVVLKRGYFAKAVAILEAKKEVSFVYSNFANIFIHPMYNRRNSVFISRPWDLEELKRGNFVDTNSMMRREDFIGFDEKMLKLEDWDLWLTLGLNGKIGQHIDEILFMSFHIDAGVSVQPSDIDYFAEIRKKHNL